MLVFASAPGLSLPAPMLCAWSCQVLICAPAIPSMVTSMAAVPQQYTQVAGTSAVFLGPSRLGGACRETGDRSMMPIIAEAPALPGVPAFLASLMQDSPESATLALSVLRDVVQARPQDRSPALDVVRAACPLTPAHMHRVG